jgi:hypothetical protein
MSASQPRGTPTGSLDLLARAALAPTAQARLAWQAWRRDHDIDTTPWNEVRMLGAVAARIDELEHDSPIRARVLGIRKFLWVQSQICLQQGLTGLAALARADIPTLVFKGAARIALDASTAQERLIRDVDVLVPLGRELAAFQTLEQEGWQIVDEPWQLRLRKLAPVAGHHAWSLRKSKAEIDLHHFSNHLNRLKGDDDGLWARSQALTWRGVPTRVPCATDALLIALIHGVRWSMDNAADWTIDACALIDGGEVDWRIFLEETRLRCVQAVAHAGLRYLQEALDKRIPDELISALTAETDSEQEGELRIYASSAKQISASQAANASAMALRRVAPGQLIRRPVRVSSKPVVITEGCLASNAEVHWARVPVHRSQDEWWILEVQARLSNPALAEAAIAQFTLPGMLLGLVRRSTQSVADDASIATFKWAIYRPMLAARCVEVVGFGYSFLGTHGELDSPSPIQIRWFIACA